MAKHDFKVSLRNNESFVAPNRFSNIFQVLDPEWLSSEWGSPDTNEDDRPKRLTLRIADKEDVDAIDSFFNSRRKQEADPKGFVKPRPDDPVEGLAKSGRIALIEDDEGITALCFAFTHEVDKLYGYDTPQIVTEIGTVISCAKGLGLTNIAISALSLVLKEQEGIDHPVIAKVSKNNEAANNLFGSTMSWNNIHSYSTIKPLFNSSAGDTIRSDNEYNSEFKASISRNWYIFDEEAQAKAATLIDILRQDKAIAPKKGKDIPFNFDEEDFNFKKSLDNMIEDISPTEIEPDHLDQHLNIDPDDPKYLNDIDIIDEELLANDCDILEHDMVEINAEEEADAKIYDHLGDIIPISSSNIYTYDKKDDESDEGNSNGEIFYDDALGM